MLGTMENGQIFVINNVRVRIAFNFILEDNIYNLTNNNIRYCILEDESLPILTPQVDYLQFENTYKLEVNKKILILKEVFGKNSKNQKTF